MEYIFLGVKSYGFKLTFAMQNILKRTPRYWQSVVIIFTLVAFMSGWREVKAVQFVARYNFSRMYIVHIIHAYIYKFLNGYKCLFFFFNKIVSLLHILPSITGNGYSLLIYILWKKKCKFAWILSHQFLFFVSIDC